MLPTTLLANPASTESVLTDVEAADITTEKETQYMIRSFFKEEDGQDLVEYSLLLAFIGLGAVAILGTVKGQINKLWTAVNTQLTNATTTATNGK